MVTYMPWMRALIAKNEANRKAAEEQANLMRQIANKMIAEMKRNSLGRV